MFDQKRKMRINATTVFGRTNSRKKNTHEEYYEFVIPDSLIEGVLYQYLMSRMESGDPFNEHRLNALIELLFVADQDGHNINQMLLIATASGYRRVVFDQHLVPHQSLAE